MLEAPEEMRTGLLIRFKLALRPIVGCLHCNNKKKGGEGVPKFPTKLLVNANWTRQLMAETLFTSNDETSFAFHLSLSLTPGWMSNSLVKIWKRRASLLPALLFASEGKCNPSFLFSSFLEPASGLCPFCCCSTPKLSSMRKSKRMRF